MEFMHVFLSFQNTVSNRCLVCYLILTWYTAKRSLAQLRQLYFKMKDKVFGTDRLGFGYNTRALEGILMEEFGPTMKMTDVEFPR